MKRPGIPKRRHGLRSSRALVSSGVAPGGVLWKRTRIRRQNAARKAREFARCYGSAERAEWIREQPSVWDGAGPCVNAHVGRKGAGARRKADADQIVPLTDAQHRAFDEHRAPFDTEDARERVRACCADVERRWLAHVGMAA